MDSGSARYKYVIDPHADFTSWVMDPIVPFDIQITNGSAEVSLHKNILMKVSSVFRDILEGDQQISSLSLKGITTNALMAIDRLIYSRPSERFEITFHKLFSCTDDVLSALLLISKYDFQMLHIYFVEKSEELIYRWEEGPGLNKICQEAERMDLLYLFDDMKRNAVSSVLMAPNLFDFPPKSVLEMSEMIDLKQENEFVKKLWSYGKKNKTFLQHYFGKDSDFDWKNGSGLDALCARMKKQSSAHSFLAHAMRDAQISKILKQPSLLGYPADAVQEIINSIDLKKNSDFQEKIWDYAKYNYEVRKIMEKKTQTFFSTRKFGRFRESNKNQ